MRNKNTITLNGQESTEITGLMIQELPPISKPALRTEIEEIDGRDGDIVNGLGYAAYDKEITIGLYGDFDIDEIIAYFDSKGTVIFSNEPEKYYNYQIIQQIDFERLVRFRTATVTFHTQPFKYSTEENPKTITNPGGGTNLFAGTTYLIKRYSNGLPTEDGTTQITINSSSANSVNFTYNANGYYMILSNTIQLEPNTTYTVAFNRTDSVSDNVNRNYFYDVDDEDNYTINSQYRPFYNATGNICKTFTTGETGKVALGWAANNDSTGRIIDIQGISIELGVNVRSMDVTNSGNIYSRPQITMTGIGNLNLSLNGNQIFAIDFGSSASTITIDTNAMEAYQGTPDNLMNRAVDGDYNNFKLNVGKNTISWSGSLTQITINNYSRWI